jgi:carboxypeptidase Taq
MLTHGEKPMTTKATLNELKSHLAINDDIGQAISLLGWDQNTYMPPGANAARGQIMATLSSLSHERLTDKRVGKWLRELEKAKLADSSTDGATVRQVRKAYDKATKIPTSFIETWMKQRSKAQAVWIEARQKNDFALFAPELKKVFDLARQMADYIGYKDHPYDALHDGYEVGSTVAEVKKVFEPLRNETVELVKAIQSSKNKVEDKVLHQAFDESLQEKFAIDTVKTFGYDFQHGRLDRTVHPFAQSITKYDVRITTRYSPSFISMALFGTMHEAGHAMYEQGISDKYHRTPLGHSISLGIHESQSRMWENLVGRSKPFWTWAYPRLQETFPKQLKKVALETFYTAINKVSPSFIRVEADEVTYNLHVMVRFEIELALLESTLNIKDLPEAWNAKYQEYLGITPPDNAQGCLQDVHWSFGLIGYFPTYTLGNIMSVQLFEAAKKAYPSIERDITEGKFDKLFSWLRENVHTHGSRYLPQDLLERATGSTLDSAPYIAYLNNKFRSLYGVER